MRRTFTRGAAVFAAALALTVVAAAAAMHAQGPLSRGDRGWAGPGGDGRGFGLLRELGIRHLDLSDAQQEQVRGILESHRAEFTNIRERLRVAFRNLNDVVTGSSFDEAAVRSRSAEVAAVQSDAAVLRAKVHSEVWSILTSEQQQKAAELKAKMIERMEQRRQRLQQRRQG